MRTPSPSWPSSNFSSSASCNPSSTGSPGGGRCALRLEIRSKRFAGREVIRGLSLTAAPSEFLALVGPSGCGKTTALTIAAGLDRDFDGTLDFGGPEPVLGCVFQTPRLLPWRTVRQNVALVLPKARRSDGTAERWLAAMGLEAVADEYPARLSGGMARRVALARAFAVEPGLLLMDEPFVSLDEPTAQRMRALLATMLERSPATVLFVTHNLREAIQLADRILVMAPGPTRVAAEVPLETPRALRDDALVERVRTDLLARPDPAFRLLA
ncbi:ABC transporter [Azospirillum argentinense]|uniref:ABC transporter n=1 Tax=Azospirillum argentinense TaxID=2970906 RepID=A0A2K1G610_9PROT|nr:ABC transporter ATP-binding protein [Azospirillum argentinense]PNR00228.1 ABC transporter [Azospirillum argentinense]